MRSYNYNDLKPCTFPVWFFWRKWLHYSPVFCRTSLTYWTGFALLRGNVTVCCIYCIPVVPFHVILERAFALLAFKRDAFWQPQICNTVFHSGLPQLQQVYSLDTVSLHLVSYFFLCGASAILFCRTWFAFIMYYGGYNFVLYLVFNHGQLLVLVEGMPALV